MVPYTCNPSTREGEAGRTQLEASLGYIQGILSSPGLHNKVLLKIKPLEGRMGTWGC